MPTEITGGVSCPREHLTRPPVMRDDSKEPSRLVDVCFSFLFLFFSFLTNYNVVLVSGVQQSDSDIYIYSFADSFPL